jgi:hypothetical protein
MKSKPITFLKYSLNSLYLILYFLVELFNKRDGRLILLKALDSATNEVLWSSFSSIKTKYQKNTIISEYSYANFSLSFI